MKIGRNDLCPCGSGKKYKKCCMEDGNIIPFPNNNKSDTSMSEYQSFCEYADENGLPIPTYMEFIGNPNPATNFINSIDGDIANRTFSDMDEMNSFMNDKMDKQNNKPHSDFLGLNPTQIKEIMDYNIGECSNICEINNNLKNQDVKDMPIIKDIINFLDLLVIYGNVVPLTTTGNLQLKFTKEFISRQWAIETQDEIRSAEDIPELGTIITVLNYMKFITVLKTRIKITEKGKDVLQENCDIASIFYDVFNFYTNNYNWLLDSYFPDGAEIIQDTALFSLYILKKQGKQSFLSEDIYKKYIIAFPMFEETLNEGFDINLGGFAYIFIFLKGFCAYFNLIEIPMPKGFSEIDDVPPDMIKINTTKTFKKLFKWKV